MNRELSAINTHGVIAERVDDELLIYVDDEFSGKFSPTGKVYEYHPVSIGGIDYNKLGRIKSALEKANKHRYRELTA